MKRKQKTLDRSQDACYVGYARTQFELQGNSTIVKVAEVKKRTTLSLKCTIILLVIITRNTINS